MKYITLHDSDFPGPTKEVVVRFDSYSDLALKVPLTLMKSAAQMRNMTDEDFFKEPEWTPEEAQMEREAMFARREARKRKKGLEAAS